MTPHLDGIVIEPERYELIEAIAESEWTRRQFFGITGAGLIVALLAGDEAAAQQPQRGGQRGGGGPPEIGGWVHIGADGAVTAYSGKVEVGQNVRTSLAQAVADELRVPYQSVKMVLADTALVPFDAGTFGSRSTPAMAPQLRRAAAAAREALLDLAAEKSKAERATLSAADGKVSGPGGKPSYTYGDLTQGQKLMKVIGGDVPTTTADKWTVAGTSAPKANGRDIVTGGHKYTSDVTRPGMVFGKVLRPKKLKSKLVSVDTRAAEAAPGVTVVRDGDLVGVVAPTEYTAAEAVKLIKAEWDAPAQVSAKDLFQHLKDKAGRGGGGGGRGGGGGTRGSIEDGLKAADKKVTATYTVAYIAHVPLEPRAAVAEWADGKLTVWTGTQRPFGVRDDLARALGVATDKVRVIVPDTGSGYGGKHTVATATEAAILARKVGKPVKLVWTREEEFTWAYFRPAGVIDVTAGAKADGTLTAWDFHNYNSGGSSLASPYAVPNHRAEFHPTDSPLAQGSYRALAATANTFARESAMDELAHAVGLDPLAFRLKNLGDAAPQKRLKAVLEAAAKQFGWGKGKPPEGHGYGLAAGTEKGSFVASVAEVAVDRKAKNPVRVVRVVTAFECGAVVNPDHLKNQIEGAVVMGLGGALFEHVDFDNGEILNPTLGDYRVPRFRDAPILETVLLDRKELPSEGAGETPIIAVAPAVANAVFQATGERLRAMPLVPNGWPK